MPPWRSVGRALLTALAPALLAPLGARAEQPAALHVGAGGYPTISDALAAARDGAHISIAPGRYAERLHLVRPVTLAAEQAGTVEVVWETQQPYEWVLGTSATSATVVGLRLRHRSPSVANNYAVYVAEGYALSLVDCDVSSASGCGVGVDGGALAMEACSVRACERHGVALFGGLDGGPGNTRACSLQRCTVSGNRLNGVLVRAGAAPSIHACEISGNGTYGLQLSDCGGEYEANRVSGNRKGGVALDASSVALDPEQLFNANALDSPVVLL